MAKKKKETKASSKHKEFIFEYLKNGRNATKAYSKVYPNASRETARANAHKLLTKTDFEKQVQDYYDKLFKGKEQRIRKLFDDLVRVAESDIADVMDYEGGELTINDFKNIDSTIVKEINHTVIESKDGVKVFKSVKMHDKLKAMSELVKILGMITEKIEHSGTIEIIPSNFTTKT